MSRRATTALAALGWSALALALVYPWRNTFIDDAMISLTYARTLATCGVFGASCGAPYYGFTSPLNEIVLAVIGRLTGFSSALVLASALEILALGLLAARLSTRLFQSASPAISLVLLLGLNPLLISTFGMETYLAIVLLVALFNCLVDEASGLTGVCLGLLVLTRPDLVVVLLAVLAVYGRSLKLGRVLLLMIAVAAPWHLYAWLALGTAAPAPLFIKHAHSWSGSGYIGGLSVYMARYPGMTLAAFAPALLALAIPFVRDRAHRRLAATAALIGVLHFAAYALLRVPPFHWYYAPATAMLIFGGWLAVISLAPSAVRRATAGLAAGALAIGVATVALAHGDFGEAPIHTNWMRYTSYREMGEWLKAHTAPSALIETEGEVGTIAYYSERPMLEPLLDSAWLVEYAARPHRPLVGALLGINFAFLHPPPPRPRSAYYLLQTENAKLGMNGVLLREWHNDGKWNPSPRYTRLFRAPQPGERASEAN